jgi:hypothetical protein
LQQMVFSRWALPVCVLGPLLGYGTLPGLFPGQTRKQFLGTIQDETGAAVRMRQIKVTEVQQQPSIPRKRTTLAISLCRYSIPVRTP